MGESKLFPASATYELSPLVMTFKAAADRPGSGSEREEPRSEQAPDPESDSASDEQLVADFLRGDAAAVDTISLWIRQAAGRYRARLRTEWDDLFQDLLLEATTVLQGGGFRGESRLRTFVWRIAHYRCLNRLRDLARRPEDELEKQTLHLVDPASPVLERLLEHESEDSLRRFVETLSEDCQRLWRLILAGQSYREISRETGISEGALRVRVLRCRQKALILWNRWLEPKANK